MKLAEPEDDRLRPLIPEPPQPSDGDLSPWVVRVLIGLLSVAMVAALAKACIGT